ncbi:MAG: CapA family protein [Anaerolineales bacterium]|nr:CapA family protein [Anaerolineales bacterium]
MRKLTILVLLTGLLLAGCNLPSSPAPAPDPDAAAITLTPFHPDLSAEEAAPSQPAWWLDPALPASFAEQVNLPEGAVWAEDAAEADVLVGVNLGDPLSQWVYALAAPFPTLTDAVSLAELQAAWGGRAGEPFASTPLLLSDETLAVLSALWGQPVAGATEVHPADELLEAAWARQPAWALIPFEEIAPRWKVLAVDGQSPIWKDFDPAAYPLSVPIGVQGEAALLAGAQTPASNRQADKLTTVIITGVTALVRATAYTMDRNGVTYPGEDVGPLLREGDITHISNEVPFAADCPLPDPVQRGLVFCSNPAYMELLTDIGTDVIELTGDHFNDWGAEAMLYTLDMYREIGLPYYGGGVNSAEARQALTLEHNGNHIAFIGCNGKGGSYASAREDHPGTVECDYALMEQQVQELVQAGYVVIATFQHNENYVFRPPETLVRDFTRISTAGAHIISGSQAHQAHGMEFTGDGAIIAYGLGNMFFDQRGVVEYGDQALITRNIIYDNRYINTEVFTIQFVDFAKPRLMTPEERAVFLDIIFNASRWNYPSP